MYDDILTKQFYIDLPKTTSKLLKKFDNNLSLEAPRKVNAPSEKNHDLNHSNFQTKTQAKFPDSRKQDRISNRNQDRTNDRSQNGQLNNSLCPFCMKGEQRVKECQQTLRYQCHKKEHIAKQCNEQRQSQG